MNPMLSNPLEELLPRGVNIYLIIIVAAVLILLYNTVAKRLVLKLIFLPVASLMWLFGVIALVLWWPAGGLANRLFPRLSASLAGRLELLGGRGGGPLRQGDREAAARLFWNEDNFPFLYRRVPKDIERPLYEDGKLTGGLDVAWLAERHMTRAALITAIIAGFTAGVILLLPPIIQFFLILRESGASIYHALTLSRPVLEQWPGQPAVLSPSEWWWNTAGHDVLKFSKSAATIILGSFAGWFLIAIGGGILVVLAAVRLWLWEKAAPYTFVTKDADVRWGYRIEARAISHATYRKQVALSETYLAGTPLYKLGQATGSSRLRGDLSAPTSGQPLCLDRDSLFQHLLVLGGTGEGKTTAILKPLMRQLMADRRVGFYVCDAKGVLWADALQVADSSGRAADVSVIGTGEGQFGVDPLAGLNPTQVAATLRSVLRQVSGEAGDNFWPEMAANVLRHILTVALTYKLTEEGRQESLEAVDPYSLWWAYQAVLDPEKLAGAIVCIREFSKNVDEEFNSFTDAADREEDVIAKAAWRKEQIPPETHASILYIEKTWASMAPETKTGIVASITQLLDGFAGARTLRERFASGRTGEKTISVAQALDGRILLNALSSIEDGLPARLVLVLLKTSLYREARRREAEFKNMEPRRNPQDRPCIVMMDEVQEIATSDPESGLSDATFWNVARSTGLAGIFATQTLAALNQALGEKAAANFIQQARSKVFFRSEDPDTIEYACWCAGSYERNRVYEDQHRESIDHRRALDGWDLFAPVDETEGVKAGAGLFWSASSALMSPTRGRLGTATRGRAYQVDTRFSNRMPQDAQNRAAVVQSEQAAAWRAEDLERSYRTEGNEVLPALTAADVLNMGRWHAFAHVQRAGAVRQDIIGIEHDYG